MAVVSFVLSIIVIKSLLVVSISSRKTANEFNKIIALCQKQNLYFIDSKKSNKLYIKD
jgi:hypothetical protein